MSVLLKTKTFNKISLTFLPFLLSILLTKEVIIISNFILENLSLTDLVSPDDVWLVMSRCYSSSGKGFSSEIGHCTSVSITDARSSSYICGDISAGIKISFLYHRLVSKMSLQKPETSK